MGMKERGSDSAANERRSLPKREGLDLDPARLTRERQDLERGKEREPGEGQGGIRRIDQVD